MKICFLTRSLGAGGAETQILLLARGLARRGHSVIVASFYGHGQQSQEGLRFISLEKKGALNNLSCFLSLKSLLRQEEVEVLYSFLATPNIFAALCTLKLPKLRVYFGIRNAYTLSDPLNWKTRLAMFLEKLLSGRAEQLIANSHAAARALESRGIPSSKISIVPNGIDTAVYRPDLEKGRLFREEHGISVSRCLVGMVANFWPWKQHELFLEVAAKLCGQREDLHFLVVGAGNESLRWEFLQHINERGLQRRFTILSQIDDMNCCYNALDLLVLPSRTESFPNVLAEAMACGTGCVATNVGDCRRILGDLGTVVDPGNIEQMIRAIVETLDSPDESQREQRAEYIREAFSLEESVNLTEKLLCTIPA